MNKNIFCKLGNLQNESDVEQFFAIRLLNKLGFKDDFIRTKKQIPEYGIGKGKKKKSYSPDYILYLDKAQTKPIMLIDVKHPSKEANEGISDAQLYSSIIRRKITAPKPEQYCIGTNGKILILQHFESDKPELKLVFEDFNIENKKYNKLLQRFSHNVLENKFKKSLSPESESFVFEKPDLGKLDGVFKNCHNLIWKREKLNPADAFYEFSKLFFLKLHLDREINTKYFKTTIPPPKERFTFSVHWIEQEEQVEINPINTILFRNLRERLERELPDKRRKRIFEKNEELILKPSTIKAVVELLEHYDFHRIDEDLNGRMFETFLSATMRGKALGQFFTPRSVTKFMSKLADLKITGQKKDLVLDACCGSGGFLIEVMAELLQKIKSNSSLSSSEKKALYSFVVSECIWGADASLKFSRIARMNMYLHGDGGSRIYCLHDSLDKNFDIEEGIPDERKREALEFKKQIKDNGKRFDVVLTNPPFAMNYRKDKEDEEKILKQYEIAKKEGTTKLTGSINSNVLFLERYYDLLKEDGKLITVIDDSVLNGVSDKKHRDFIRKNFIVKAVISLPFNTFKNAGTSTKTSILYLKKKTDDDEKQPSIFMAICNNIGHDDFGRTTLGRNNLVKILKLYKEYERDGKLKTVVTYNHKVTEVLTCPMQVFIVTPDKLSGRLDAFYYSPELKKLQKHLDLLSKKKEILLLKGSDFKKQIVDNLSNKEAENSKDEVFKYTEVGDVNKKGGLINFQEETLENLPTRARKVVKKDDVIIAKNISSLGNVMIIPDFLNNQLASTGFIVIRPKTKVERNILWALCRNKVVTYQMYYLSATAVQPEVSETIFKNDLLLPFPFHATKQKEITKKVNHLLKYSHKLDAEIKAIDNSLTNLNFG